MSTKANAEGVKWRGPRAFCWLCRLHGATRRTGRHFTKDLQETYPKYALLLKEVYVWVFFFFFQITKRGSIFLGLNTRYFQRIEEPVVQFPPFFSRSQVFWKRSMYFPLSRLLPHPPHVPAPWWDLCWRTHQITASHFSEEPVWGSIAGESSKVSTSAKKYFFASCFCLPVPCCS